MSRRQTKPMTVTRRRAIADPTKGTTMSKTAVARARFADGDTPAPASPAPAAPANGAPPAAPATAPAKPAGPKVYEPAPYSQGQTEVTQCPDCGKFNDNDASYCDQCGMVLADNPAVRTADGKVYKPAPYIKDNGSDGDGSVVCPACGKGNGPDASFCDQCGIRLAGNPEVKVPASQAKAAAPAPDATAPAPAATSARARALMADTGYTGGNGTPFEPAPYHADPDETVQCQACSLMNDVDAVYCDQCGAELASPGGQPYTADPDEIVTCPSCHLMNDVDASWCDQCDTELAGNAAVAIAALPAAPAPLTAAGAKLRNARVRAALADDPMAPVVTSPGGPAPANDAAPGPAGGTPAVPAPSTGAMVALYPDDPSAFAIDSPGAEPAEQIHLTVAFLGQAVDLGPDDITTLRQAVGTFAANYVDLEDGDDDVDATGMAVSLFGDDDNNDGTPDALVLLMEGVDLAEVQSDLVEPFSDAGYASGDHPNWYPHVTLAYGDTDTTAAQGLVGASYSFSTISLVLAGDRIDYALGQPNDDDTSDMDDDSSDTSADETGTDDNGDTAGDDGSGIEEAIAPMSATTDRFSTVDRNRWQGVVAVEGQATGDGRKFAEGAITWRTLPVALMIMTRNPDGGDGHAGAELCGQMDRMWRVGNEIWGGGTFDLGSPAGIEARRLVDAGLLRGVSVDLDSIVVEFEDMGDTLEDMLAGDGIMLFTEARVSAVTLCPIPALMEASISLVDADDPTGIEIDPALVASAGPPEHLVVRSFIPLVANKGLHALVASGGNGIPASPPAGWFAKPSFSEYTHLRISPDGRLSGHVAAWDACHMGYADRCVSPPRVKGNAYSCFRTGQVITAEGTAVATGPLVMDTVHPSLRLRASDAQAHYADTGCAIADVAVYDDEFGIVVAGAVRPGVSEEHLRVARGSNWSGDWRSIGGRLEMVGLLAVNIAGFTKPALAASASAVTDGVRPGRLRAEMELTSGRINALVAAGMIPNSGHRTATLAAQVDALSSKVAELDCLLAPTRAAALRARAAKIRANTSQGRRQRALAARSRIRSTK